MERYTKKREQSGFYITANDEFITSDYGIPYEKTVDKKVFEAIDKLGKLEDIEEELGIDLITLFGALQCGIYGKSGNIVYPYNVLLVEKKLRAYPLDIWEESWDLVDYGKTWALTKEELI